MSKSITGAAVAGVTLLICLFVLLGGPNPFSNSLGTIQAFLATGYSDPRLVAWAGVAMNLAVVAVALFLNVLLDNFRRPRFSVTCGEAAPWQIEKGAREGEDHRFLHVRLRVQNVGRSYEEACEVRIEQVLRLHATNGANPDPVDEHDPRPLKWVGRDTKPTALDAGAFDFADLGVQLPESQELFRLDFDDRGHLDLWLNAGDLTGFRVAGAVYGRHARPKRFAFDLSWSLLHFGPVLVKEA